MNGPLDSPRVAPRRSILACLALLAGAAMLLGCGSDERGDVSFGENASRDFQAKLDVIQDFIDDDNCERATEAIGTLSEAVDISEETSEQAKADMQDLLTDLDEQVADQCEESEPTTSSSTSTEEDTSSTEEEPTSTEETTSTKETTTTETTTTEEPSTTTPEPPAPPSGGGPPSGTPPGQGGGGPSGGVGPSFESGRKVPG